MGVCLEVFGEVQGCMVLDGDVWGCIEVYGCVQCCIVEMIYNNEIYKVCLGTL